MLRALLWVEDSWSTEERGTIFECFVIKGEHFELGLEGCIEVLQESKTDEDRPKEGKLCTSSKEGGGQGGAASDTDLDSKSSFSTY